MYTPKNDTPVRWHFQDGRLAAVTQFTDNGIPERITIAWELERYGDPREANPGVDLGSFRFSMDPIKGAWPGLLRTIAEGGPNRYGFEMLADPMAAIVQSMDGCATLLEAGENSAIFREFELDTTGYSTDPKNPQLVSLPNPPYGLGSFKAFGRTFWQYNYWPNPVPASSATQSQAPVPAPVPSERGVNSQALRALLVEADKVKLPKNGGGRPAEGLRILREGLRNLLASHNA